MGEERTIPPLPKPVPSQPGRIGGREGEILKEVPATLGAVLWQDARHVRLWLESHPQDRALLFPRSKAWVRTKRLSAKSACNELSDALDELAVLREAPTEVSASRIAAAAEAVALWADERNFTQTAIVWAELAASVHPDDAHLANLAGRITREAHEYDRAEVWFKRGMGAARAAGDKVELARGHLGYGTLCKDMGRVRAAAKHMSAGSRLARRWGPLSLAAEAQHDACALLTVRGRLDEAEVRARRALRWYGKNHKRLPFFAADVALLCIFQGNYIGAARLLKSTIRLIQQPAARTVVAALFTRALTGAGHSHDAETYRRRAVKRLERDFAMEATARWHLADAERIAQNWERAEAEAERALAVATATGDHEAERLIRKVLKLIERRDRGPLPAPNAEFNDVIQELRERLAVWTPRRVRRRVSSWNNDWSA